MSVTKSASSAKTATNDTTVVNKEHPLWQIIRTVPNFPKPGIDFYDIPLYCAVILMR